MKDEETDWHVYCILAGQGDLSTADLLRRSGLSSEELGSSLRRLEKNLLVERRDERVKLLSVNESLIRCQVKYDTSLPYIIENGTLKMKKR